jgi:hypothetical protein
MKINVAGGTMDISPGSIFRFLLEDWLGSDWDDCVTVYIEVRPGEHRLSRQWMLHNESGPATVKTDGACEWWLNGEKLFCKTQTEFECYMRNKAFW